MRNIKFILFTALTAFSSLVFAHSGHGEHAVIFASGQTHPIIGNEHLLVVSLMLALYLTLKWARKK